MQSFMGDRPSTADPAELAAALLHLGVTCPPLRDELYCQVVKQLSSGSDPGCSRRGWTLMYLFLEAFPPYFLKIHVEPFDSVMFLEDFPFGRPP